VTDARRHQLLDRRDDRVGRGVMRHVADAGEKDQLRARHRGGQRAGIDFRRHHGVAVAGDDDDRQA